MSDIMDLGHGHTLRFVSWKPDRSIPANAEAYKDIPDVERAGTNIEHTAANGTICKSFLMFDHAGPQWPGEKWHVESWEPLTISPSLLCRACGDHGFIRGGKWVPA